MDRIKLSTLIQTSLSTGIGFDLDAKREALLYKSEHSFTVRGFEGSGKYVTSIDGVPMRRADKPDRIILIPIVRCP